VTLSSLVFPCPSKSLRWIPPRISRQPVTKASHARSLPFRLQRRNVRSQTQSLDSGSSKSAQLSHRLHSTSDQALTTVYSTWIHFVQSHLRFLATRHPDPATKRTPPSPPPKVTIPASHTSLLPRVDHSPQLLPRAIPLFVLNL
jgi:hypothetical protein